MSIFSDFFGPTKTTTDDESKKKTKDESEDDDEDTKASSTKSGGSSSGFWSSFLGSGGAGSSLISSAGSIGLGLVNNDGDRIRANFELEMSKLRNDASLSQSQFKLESDRLEREREAALATYADQKRNDQLTLVLIVGGVFTLIFMAVILARRGPATSAPKRQRRP